MRVEQESVIQIGLVDLSGNRKAVHPHARLAIGGPPFEKFMPVADRGVYLPKYRKIFLSEWRATGRHGETVNGCIRHESHVRPSHAFPRRSRRVSRPDRTNRSLAARQYV